MPSTRRLRPSFARLAVAIVIASAASCNGIGCKHEPSIRDDERRPPRKTAPPVDVCPSYAAAYCARLAQCLKPNRDYVYGDDARCRESLTAYCLFELHAPGSGDTPAILAECRDDFASIRCDDWVVGLFPKACDPPGARPNGAPCGLRAQCASYHCLKKPDADCGVCAPPPPAGASCADGHCARGLVCSASRICRTPGGLASPCARDDECVLGLGCMAGRCAKPAAMGAPCTPYGAIDPDCDHRAGAYCAGDPLRCVAFSEGKEGEPCVDRSECAGSFCDVRTRRCASLVSIGAACDAGQPGTCLYPGVCVDGACAAPDLTKCK